MKNGLLDDAAVPEVLHHDALEKCRGHPGVPDRIRIDDDDGATGANPKARGLAALDPIRSEEQPFAVEQIRQQRIQFSAAPVR